MILQETYYGKDAHLLECENCISEMKKELALGKNPNKSSYKTKLESIFAKKFGFEKVFT